MSQEYATCPYCNTLNEKPGLLTKLKKALPAAISQVAAVYFVKKLHYKTGSTLKTALQAKNLYSYFCGTETMECGNPRCGQEFPVKASLDE